MINWLLSLLMPAIVASKTIESASKTRLTGFRDDFEQPTNTHRP